MKCENDDSTPNDAVLNDDDEQMTMEQLLSRVLGQSVIVRVHAHENGLLSVREVAPYDSQAPSGSPPEAPVEPVSAKFGALSDEDRKEIQASNLLMKVSLGVIGGSPDMREQYASDTPHGAALYKMVIGVLCDMLLQMQEDHIIVHQELHVFEKGILVAKRQSWTEEQAEAMKADLSANPWTRTTPSA